MINKAKQSNKEVLESVSYLSEPARSGASSCITLRGLCEYSDADVAFVLGQAGLKLREFVSSLDFSHPDLPTLFGSTFNDDTLFCKYIREMLEISVFCRQRQFVEAPTVIGNHFLDLIGSYESPIIKEMVSKIFPCKKAVRFIASPYERACLRKQKTVQPIDLASFLRRGFEVWNAAQPDFERLIRYRRPYDEEIAQAKKKASRYLDLGCTGMFAEVQRSIEEFQSQIEDSYYGFNRVTLTGSAIILARMMGYGFGNMEEKKGFCLAAHRSLFKDFDFGSTNEVFGYEPRIYPYHLLEGLASCEVNQIVTALENFSDAGGKPIFDYYGVLVPGLNFPKTANKGQYDEKIAVDKTLIERGLLIPALVGEVDGKCYFIAYMV